MVSHRETGFAGLADDLLLFNWVAFLDIDRTQMAVKRRKSKSMVDDDGIAVDSQVADETHDSAIGGLHRVSFGDREIEP